MLRQTQSEITILNAIQATGAGSKIYSGDFKHIAIDISVAGMGVGDTIAVKIQGSSALDAPDFDAAITASNSWQYVECVDSVDGSSIDGNVGIIFSANGLKRIIVNEDNVRWITVNVISISDAVNTSCTAKATLATD